MLGSFSCRRSGPAKGELTPFNLHRFLSDWDNGDGMRISDAATGIAVFGAKGSGRTGEIGHRLAHAHLAAGIDGLVHCAKSDECRQWQKWACKIGRENDLIIIEPAGTARFNWMDYEANRARDGADPAINIVAMLGEIVGVGASGAGRAKGGDAAGWAAN